VVVVAAAGGGGGGSAGGGGGGSGSGGDGGGGGGGVVAGARVVGRWARCPAGFLFLFCEILSAESHLRSRHMCVERIWRGSRQRSLCRLAPPSGLCRELPLGRGSAER
jgi:hypothetical protein